MLIDYNLFMIGGNSCLVILTAIKLVAMMNSMHL